MSRILVVDDEEGVRFTLAEIMRELGHEAIAVASAHEALATFDEDVELVLSDWIMPEMDGLALLQALRAKGARAPFVLLTARGSERLAARAIKEGAFDYLPKPFELEELEAIVGRALAVSTLRGQLRRAEAHVVLGKPFVGNAPRFRAAIDRAVRFGANDAPVLVRGETGTGKELLAGLVHAASSRAKAPFVRFNCAAIAEDLAESELFGHVRGAFTGATNHRRGFFEQAHGGTLVLDEIGELSPRLQPKLLRALQSGEIQPVGAKSISTVDVRVIACTHRDLLEETRARRFREDLYYRLAVLDVEMPALRQRAGDVPLLAESFAREAARRFGLEAISLRPEFLSALEGRAWPGNVRELENVVMRAVALSNGGEIGVHLLDDQQNPPHQPSECGSFREQVDALEKRLLSEALGASGENQSEAARRLGLSRVTFLDKLKRHGLHGPSK